MKRKEAPHSEDPLYGVSSSWTSLQVHEVFLSFRERDTRRGFTDYLYTSLVDVGIRVFRDDNGLKVGEEFGPELVCIIKQSKISIWIILKNYASSKWCLHGLAQMLKCKRSIGQLVLPIFYKVEPPQLRHLTGRFRDAINAHKGHLDEMVVKEWEEALKEVSTLEGWESEKIDFRHEGTLIKLFVKKVMSELKELFQLFVPEQSVGIDDHMEQIMSMIDDKSDGTSIVGIYGMSGVDETTIAKRRGIEGLILMFAIKEDKDGKLMMHDQMRDLGRQIVRLENPRKPKKRNRLWIHEEAVDVLDNNKGIGEVEARDSCILTAPNFPIMPAISFPKLDLNQKKKKKSFPKLDVAIVSGDFTDIKIQKIRWLRWGGVPPDFGWGGVPPDFGWGGVPPDFCWGGVPPDFGAEKLVLRELIILDLSWSKVTEDWQGWSEIKMEKLKVLDLTGCSDLLITPDFSDYKDLEILILERCYHLVKLDPSIGNLKRLVSLNLKFCSQLHGLPVELGCTTALKELFIDGTSVRQIPISIGNLKQLEILSGLKCFPLTHLPSSICYLAALSELSLDGAKISELPRSLGELLKLRRLSLRDCRYLGKLPYSIGKMRSLEELDISATNISELPDSIRKLKNLRVLRMDSSFIRAIPGEIGNLTKLEELHASWCQSLKGAIPGDIGELHRLRSLTLGHSSISSLPPEVSTISGLHTLDLIQCNEIEELPKLPPSLICLRVSSKRMKAIPLYGNLKKLEELCLSDGDPKARRPPFAIEEIEGLEGLKALKRLDISNCKIRHINGIGQLTSLRSLILSYCDYLDSLLDLSNLKSLKVLEIRRCKMIHQIEGLEKLTTLEKLNIRECPAENSVQVQNARKDVRARLKGK